MLSASRAPSASIRKVVNFRPRYHGRLSRAAGTGICPSLSPTFSVTVHVYHCGMRLDLFRPALAAALVLTRRGRSHGRRSGPRACDRRHRRPRRAAHLADRRRRQLRRSGVARGPGHRRFRPARAHRGRGAHRAHRGPRGLRRPGDLRRPSAPSTASRRRIPACSRGATSVRPPTGCAWPSTRTTIGARPSSSR